jgi:YidC/Oxa1 family membrane protein insertase
MQSKKVMELYKEHKVNPASGCWPLLVQLPIFILFYNVLTRAGADQFADATFLTIHLDGSLLAIISEAINLVDPETGIRIANEQLGTMMVIFSAMSNPSLLFANSVMWLPNTVLLITNSFLMWYQQHLTSAGNPQMAMMKWFMPIMMAFICLGIPGGVLLYWGVSSLMGVASQVSLVRRTSLEMSKKPVLLQEKPTHKEAE